MKIKKIKTERLQIPLRVRFSQSNNSTHFSDSTIVRVITENGTVGIGECCPRTYVTGENFASVQKDLLQIQALLSNFCFKELRDVITLITQLLPEKIGLAALCGLELALLDAWSKENQKSILSALNLKSPKELHYSGVFPLTTPKKLEKLLHKYQAFDFRDIKLKIDQDLEQNLQKIQLVRQYFGHSIAIRLDVNTCWTLEEALRQIPAFLKAGVYNFEQIFPKKYIAQMHPIIKKFGKKAQLVADEALTSFQQAQQLIEQQAFNQFNLKISKNGGIFNSLKIYELAQKNGIPCQLGAHFGETSILAKAGIILSALAPNIQIREGAFGTYLLERDICEPSIMFNQKAKINFPAKFLNFNKASIIKT